LRPRLDTRPFVAIEEELRGVVALTEQQRVQLVGFGFVFAAVADEEHGEVSLLHQPLTLAGPLHRPAGVG
jgi:hypothetical protein